MDPESGGDERAGQSAFETEGLDGFDTKPDPLVWLQDSVTGLYYRRVTDNGVESNGWFNSTYLVELEQGLESVQKGTSDFTLMVPLNDSHTETFDMNRVAEDQERFVEMRIGGPTKTGNVTMRSYEDATNTSERVARIKGSNRSGMYGTALFNETTQDISARILGPEPWWVIDDMLTEDGTTVNESAVVAIPLSEAPASYEKICGQIVVDSPTKPCGEHSGGGDPGDGDETPNCDDGRDNDNDAWVDLDDPGCTSTDDDMESDTPIKRKFYLMGELKWCTGHESNWDEAQSQLRDDLQRGFRGERDTRVYLVDLDWNFCVHDPNGYNHAISCDQGSVDPNECEYGDGHTYDYYDARTRSEVYRDGAWDYLAHFRSHFACCDIPKVSTAQVIHDGQTDDGQHCGVASFPDIWHGWDEDIDGPKPTGDSVAGADPSSYQLGECRREWLTHTHEVGHNYFTWHSDSGQPLWADGCDTVMSNDAVCRVNAFSNTNRRNVNHCIDDHRTYCPRLGTG